MALCRQDTSIHDLQVNPRISRFSHPAIGLSGGDGRLCAGQIDTTPRARYTAQRKIPPDLQEIFDVQDGLRTSR